MLQKVVLISSCFRPTLYIDIYTCVCVYAFISRTAKHWRSNLRLKEWKRVKLAPGLGALLLFHFLSGQMPEVKGSRKGCFSSRSLPHVPTFYTTLVTCSEGVMKPPSKALPCLTRFPPVLLSFPVLCPRRLHAGCPSSNQSNPLKQFIS